MNVNRVRCTKRPVHAKPRHLICVEWSWPSQRVSLDKHIPGFLSGLPTGQASGVCFLALSLILSYEVTAEQLISPSPSDLLSLRGDCVKGKTRPRNPYWIIPFILGIFLNKRKISKKNVSTRSQRVVSSGGSNNESGIGFLYTDLMCLCLNEDELNAWKTHRV